MSELNGQILASTGSRVSQLLHEVSLATKVVAWFIVLLLNAGMLFYILLFALQQTNERQGAWLKSFICWLISEVFIVSSFVCIFQHLVVPAIVIKDIKFMKQRVLDTIRDYKDSLHFDKERGSADVTAEFDNNDSKFNAASTLFVSYRVAKSFPDLKESQIIRRFVTQWPRKSYKRRTQEVESSYNATGQAMGRSLAMVVMYLLGNLMNLPAGIQDVILQAVSTATVGSMALVHVRLYGILPLFVLLPTIVVACTIHFWVQSGKRKDIVKLAQSKPIGDIDIQERQKHPGDAGWQGNNKKSFGLKQSALEKFSRTSHSLSQEYQNSESSSSKITSSNSTSDSLSDNSIRRSEKVSNFQPIRRAVRYGESLLSEIARLHSLDEKRQLLAHHAQNALESIVTEDQEAGSKVNSASDNVGINSGSDSEVDERYTFNKISGVRKYSALNINNEAALLTKAHIRASDWVDGKLGNNDFNTVKPYDALDCIDGGLNVDTSASGSDSTDSDDTNNQMRLHRLKITQSLDRRKQKQKKSRPEMNNSQSFAAAPERSVGYIRRLMKEHLRSEFSDDSDGSFPQTSPQSSVESSLSYNSDESARKATFRTQKLRHIVQQPDDHPAPADELVLELISTPIMHLGLLKSIPLVSTGQETDVIELTQGVSENIFSSNEHEKSLPTTEESSSLVRQHDQTLSRIAQMREQIAQRKLNKLREKEILIAEKKEVKRLVREEEKQKAKSRKEKKDSKEGTPDSAATAEFAVRTESFANVSAAPSSTRGRMMEQRKLRLASTGNHL